MEIIHFLITGSFNTSDLAHLDQTIRSNSLNFTIWASVILILLTIVSGIIKKPNGFTKALLFFSMIAIISLNTLYLAGSTIYKNQRSITKGPVHWHADFEVWNCGTELDLVDPKGWSNKIGSPVIHEHNDKRMHIEGVVLTDTYATLGHFFELIGGKLNAWELVFDSTDGKKELKNGMDCNGQPGMVQVFVYKTMGDTFSQERLLYPEDYMLSAESGVPPGDCIIVEFDSQIKTRTEHLCQSYEVQKELGKIKEVTN